MAPEATAEVERATDPLWCICRYRSKDLKRRGPLIDIIPSQYRDATSIPGSPRRIRHWDTGGPRKTIRPPPTASRLISRARPRRLRISSPTGTVAFGRSGVFRSPAESVRPAAAPAGHAAPSPRPWWRSALCATAKIKAAATGFQHRSRHSRIEPREAAWKPQMANLQLNRSAGQITYTGFIEA